MNETNVKNCPQTTTVFENRTTEVQNWVFGFWILRSVWFDSVFRNPNIFMWFRTPLTNICVLVELCVGAVIFSVHCVKLIKCVVKLSFWMNFQCYIMSACIISSVWISLKAFLNVPADKTEYWKHLLLQYTVTRSSVIAVIADCTACRSTIGWNNCVNATPNVHCIFIVIAASRPVNKNVNTGL